MPKRYIIKPDGTKEYLPDNTPLDLASPQGPAGPILEQRNVMQQAAQGPLHLPLLDPNVIKMSSDIGLSGTGAVLGSFGGPAAPLTIPLGAAAGQYLSDTLFQRPQMEKNINAALAFGAPVAAESMAVAGGQLGGISKGNIKDTMVDALRHPIETSGGLAITRPGVGLSRGAESNMANSLDAQLLAEEAGPSLPISRQQVATTTGILNKYQGVAHLNPTQVQDILRNSVTQGKSAMTPELQAAQSTMDGIAARVQQIAQGRGGYVDLTDVEDLLDQLRQPVDFGTPGGNARILAYKRAQGEIDRLIRAEITDPADLKLYNETKAAMKARLDARDALRSEVGKLIPEGGEGDFYKGMNSFIRRINQPTPAGEVADTILKNYDATHKTNWFPQVKRLNQARQWSPDDRIVARSIWSIFRAELSLAGIPFATKVATEGAIAAPFVTPPAREYIKSLYKDTNTP